jgi:hypothetical protein
MFTLFQKVLAALEIEWMLILITVNPMTINFSLPMDSRPLEGHKFIISQQDFPLNGCFTPDKDSISIGCCNRRVEYGDSLIVAC